MRHPWHIRAFYAAAQKLYVILTRCLLYSDRHWSPFQGTPGRYAKEPIMLAGLMLIAIVLFYLLFGLLIRFSERVIHQQENGG